MLLEVLVRHRARDLEPVRREPQSVDGVDHARGRIVQARQHHPVERLTHLENIHEMQHPAMIAMTHLDRVRTKDTAHRPGSRSPGQRHSVTASSVNRYAPLCEP